MQYLLRSYDTPQGHHICTYVSQKQYQSRSREEPVSVIIIAIAKPDDETVPLINVFFPGLTSRQNSSMKNWLDQHLEVLSREEISPDWEDVYQAWRSPNGRIVYQLYTRLNVGDHDSLIIEPETDELHLIIDCSGKSDER